MRLWLEQAGVFDGRWRVNQARLEAIIGASLEDVDDLAMLTREQRAYLRTIANLGAEGTYVSSDVEKLATTTYGIKFNEKNLPKQVLYPLEELGYITLERGTKQAGRGAKPFLVTPTEKFTSEIFEPILAQFEAQVAPELRPLLRKPFETILAELDAESRHVRGLALEALAFKLMRLVDLDYVGTRLRGDATGGAEVDVIFEGSRLLYSRWQVQCKNTKRVTLEDVAKEVGLTRILKSNVIVIVTTGTITDEARNYSNIVMKDSNLNIVMIDGNDLARIRDNPTDIVDVFDREARHAMRLKTLDMFED